MTDLYHRLRNLRFLLIEDDVWVRDSLLLFFESEGCNITALQTAEEALDLIENRHFDIIITDYRLPGMNGLEFIRKLNQKKSQQVIILITAYGNKNIFNEARKAGVKECIPKPFNSEAIEASLERLL